MNTDYLNEDIKYCRKIFSEKRGKKLLQSRHVGKLMEFTSRNWFINEECIRFETRHNRTSHITSLFFDDSYI